MSAQILVKSAKLTNSAHPRLARGRVQDLQLCELSRLLSSFAVTTNIREHSGAMARASHDAGQSRRRSI